GRGPESLLPEPAGGPHRGTEGAAAALDRGTGHGRRPLLRARSPPLRGVSSLARHLRRRPAAAARVLALGADPAPRPDALGLEPDHASPRRARADGDRARVVEGAGRVRLVFWHTDRYPTAPGVYLGCFPRMGHRVTWVTS